MTTRQVRQALLIFLAAGITAACSASRPVKYYVLDTGTPAARVPDSSPARFPDNGSWSAAFPLRTCIATTALFTEAGLFSLAPMSTSAGQNRRPDDPGYAHSLLAIDGSVSFCIRPAQ